MAPFRKLRTKLGLRKDSNATLPLPKGCIVGRWTYGFSADNLHHPHIPNDVHIGAFCSIAPGVIFLQTAEHLSEYFFNYPLEIHLFKTKIAGEDVESKGPIVIGNDVWIGRDALILSGVRIGDGAIIGAGAVVTKDVPPYSIAAGNPARIKRYRYNEDTINSLCKIAWWNWTDEKIRSEQQSFCGGIEGFIDRHG